MNKKEFVQKIDERLKLVRTEWGYNQEQMASVLGISKKTLVEIEKGRSSLGWTGSVALCAIFSESQVLEGALGGEAMDMIYAIAFETEKPLLPKTMGGKIWWRTIEEGSEWKIQQNIISQHYRALDDEGRRLAASFDLEVVKGQIAGR